MGHHSLCCVIIICYVILLIHAAVPETPSLTHAMITVSGSAVSFYGKNVFLTCTSVTPGVTYAWYRDGQEVLNEVSTRLEISPITSSGAGTYECLSSNSDGDSPTSESVHINVLRNPTLGSRKSTDRRIQRNPYAKAADEETLFFACSFSNPGNMTLYNFLKDNIVLISSQNTTYHIDSMEKEDAGRYTCSVTYYGLESSQSRTIELRYNDTSGKTRKTIKVVLAVSAVIVLLIAVIVLGYYKKQWDAKNKYNAKVIYTSNQGPVLAQQQQQPQQPEQHQQHQDFTNITDNGYDQPSDSQMTYTNIAENTRVRF